MANVWWCSIGVIHYDFMKHDSFITAKVYCGHLDGMMEKLKQKQTRLVYRSIPMLLHDNARPHTVRMTVTKLQELEFEFFKQFF